MTEEVITPEVVETVDAAPAEPVADAPVVAADPVQPDAPAAVEEVAEVAEVVAEPVAVKPLSDSAQTVLAWIRSMAAVAPHHSQLTFETFLAQNIASLDEFDAALGD